MIEIGKYNTLYANRVSDFGMYLRDAKGNEVLLPNKYVPEDMLVDDEIEAFVYNDSMDRITATTRQPLILLNELKTLKVVEVNAYGAFLDWGLEKDLLVPFSQQSVKMEPGNSYLVYLYLDEKTERLVATSKISRFLDNSEIKVEVGQEVDLIVDKETDLGWNVIIDEAYNGLVFRSDVFQSVQIGQHLKGYIKKIRPDNKIDVTLQKASHKSMDKYSQIIMDELTAQNGFLDLNDKSDPAEITARLEMSKKNFKKAIGALYKKRRITMEKGGIRIV